MPAQSPTLSPTLSAIVAGLRGSSSGMPASTLPTRSAPTSAALVKMPPPTRRNSASSEPPKPKPTRIAELVFWNAIMISDAPSRPRPTVNMPATPPVRNATCSAAGIEPLLGRRRGAHVAAHREAHADEAGEARQEAAEDERAGAEQTRLHVGQRDVPGHVREAVGLHLRRGDEHDDRQRHQDDADGLELPLQVRHRALLDRLGDLLHLLGALVGGEHASHQEEADPEREQRGRDGGQQDQPLTSVQVEGLIAALGGQNYVRHFFFPKD